MSQMNEFAERINANFNSLADEAFSSLDAGEGLILNLEAEDQIYLRLNGNRIRQNTNVEQVRVSARFQSQGRTASQAFLLTGKMDRDRTTLKHVLNECREEVKVLPPDPHQIAIRNNGTSSEEFKGDRPCLEHLVDTLTTPAEGLDLAGLFAGGTAIRANRNSQGQSHWFATETFFMDYSLYDGPRAAKSIYAGSCWQDADWSTNLARTREQLSLLGRPEQNIKPGSHRTYLAPGAVSELIGTLNWGALSASAWKQGLSGFKKLADRETKLSPLLSLRENFSLGLVPRFNSLGEVAPETVSLIEKGELKELLVSSKTAKEYGLQSNAASDWEHARSLEILPGLLEEKSILQELGTGLYLSNLHYLNWSDRTAARITGMTRYACFWVENGEVVGPIKDLRFDESMYDALGSKLIGLTRHAEIDPATDTYGQRAIGGKRVPGMMIDGFTFTL